MKHSIRLVDSYTGETLDVSNDYREALAQAVEQDHTGACTDNTCDILHAWEEGYVEVAASFLMGATEAGFTEAVVERFHKDISHVYGLAEWGEWESLFRSSTWECSCGSFVWERDDYCDNCGSEKPREPEPEDFTISPSGNLGSLYSVGIVEGDFVGEFHTYREALEAISERMKRKVFFPSVWSISDHGNALELSFPTELKEAREEEPEEPTRAHEEAWDAREEANRESFFTD